MANLNLSFASRVNAGLKALGLEVTGLQLIRKQQREEKKLENECYFIGRIFKNAIHLYDTKERSWESPCMCLDFKDL